MISIAANRQLYIDVRSFERADQLSYDLSQHLPRRLAVGSVVVLADNPPVFLSVIRKRLAKLQYEIERECARTLNQQKRLGLTREVVRLRTARFTSKPDLALPDVLCITPYAMAGRRMQCRTLYITTAISADQLRVALKTLRPNGLLVVYGNWAPQYEAVLASYRVV